MSRLIALLLFAAIPAPKSAADDFDHVAAIKGLRDGDSKKGRELYATHCVSCHGKDGKLALNPLARRFAADDLKFGTDPYALWKTISYGNGLMFRWDAVLSPEERYQIVHHIREDIIKPNNPAHYFKPDADYFAKLPDIAKKDAAEQAANTQKVEVARGMIDGTAGKNMVYGPFLQHGLAYSEPINKDAAHIENATEKALIVDLPGDSVLCYDAFRLSVSGVWSGKIADTSKTHHTSYKGSRCLMPGGEIQYADVDGIGWAVGAPQNPENADHLLFKGLHLHGPQVILSYDVAGRSVLELPGADEATSALSRSFRIAPGKENLFCLVGRGENLPKAKVAADDPNIALVKGGDGALWLSVPPSQQPLQFTLWFSPTHDFEIPDSHAVPDFASLMKGGPRRWPHVVQTAVAPGDNAHGYAADILTVPLANPYGSWMRLTALDFFSDGRIAASTLSGDVWIVSWTDDNPNALTWSRFAAGLYEPLGLRIVDDTIYVRGRDRITRLHDLNGDGEADHYESFHEDRNEIGAGYHAFVYDLQTDKAGNFYYSQSGYKSPLTGAVVRVSPDGKKSQSVGTDLRNPNGMGAGGPDDWVTITDNPSGRAVYNGFTLAKEGAHYGYEKDRTVPMLVVLPARIDSSSGGQCWSDPERWGPLSGSIIHTSYSGCRAFYCLTQDTGTFPNGFAIPFFELQSGALRPRVSPVDRHVYIACQKGWDTKAPYDGIIYRLRHTGEKCHLISGAAATKTGIRLTFASDLDPATVLPTNITLSRESDDQKGPPAKGTPADKVTLIDRRTIDITVPGIEEETVEHRTTTDKKTGAISVKVNPAYTINVHLKAADGTPVEQTVFATINALP